MDERADPANNRRKADCNPQRHRRCIGRDEARHDGEKSGGEQGLDGPHLQFTRGRLLVRFDREGSRLGPAVRCCSRQSISNVDRNAEPCEREISEVQPRQPPEEPAFPSDPDLFPGNEKRTAERPEDSQHRDAQPRGTDRYIQDAIHADPQSHRSRFPPELQHLS